MIDRMARNWLRIAMWMLTAIALFESFTVAQSMTLKIIMWSGSGVMFIIGLLKSGEELLD